MEGVGGERGGGRGVAGSAERAERKKRGRPVKSYHAPAPAGRMNLTYLSGQRTKFER